MTDPYLDAYLTTKDNLSLLYNDAATTIPAAAQTALTTFNAIDQQILNTDASRQAFQDAYAEAKGTIGAVLDETSTRLKHITDPDNLSKLHKNLSDTPGFTRAQYGALIGAGTVGLKRALEGKDVGEVTKGMLSGALVGGAGAYFLPKLLEAALAAQGVKVGAYGGLDATQSSPQSTQQSAQQATTQIPGMQNLLNVPITATEPFRFGGGIDPLLAPYTGYTHFYNPDRYEKAYRQYYQLRSRYPAVLGGQLTQNQQAGGSSWLGSILSSFGPTILQLLSSWFSGGKSENKANKGEEKEAAYINKLLPDEPGMVKEAHPLLIAVAAILGAAGLTGAGYYVGNRLATAESESKIKDLEMKVMQMQHQQQGGSWLPNINIPQEVFTQYLPAATIGAGLGGLYSWLNYRKRKKKEEEEGVAAPETPYKDILFGGLGGALAGTGVVGAYNALKALSQQLPSS